VSALALPVACLPLGLAIARLGVSQAAHWHEADPWRIHTRLGL
jgi:hypothetical protein